MTRHLTTLLSLAVALVTVLGAVYGATTYFVSKPELGLTLDHRDLRTAGAIGEAQRSLKQQQDQSELRFWQQRLEHLQLQREYYESQIRDTARRQEDTTWVQERLERVKRDIIRTEEKLHTLER